MSVLDDILGNKELGDDQEISIGENKFNLGELRARNAERETLRGERESMARERDDYRGKFETISQATTRLLSDASRAADADAALAPPKSPKDQLREALGPLLEEDDGTKALFEDKVFGKALSKVEERAYNRSLEKQTALEEKLARLEENLTKGFEGLTRAQVVERANRWYDVNKSEIPKVDGKRMSLDAIHNYAVERNIVRPGQPNIVDYDRALEVLTEPQRVEARMTDAERRGYEKGLEQGRAQAGRVIPIFGDRSAGATPGDKISTVGKSAKQIVQERLQQGLAELSAAENE